MKKTYGGELSNNSLLMGILQKDEDVVKNFFKAGEEIGFYPNGDMSFVAPYKELDQIEALENYDNLYYFDPYEYAYEQISHRPIKTIKRTIEFYIRKCINETNQHLTKHLEDLFVIFDPIIPKAIEEHDDALLDFNSEKQKEYISNLRNKIKSKIIITTRSPRGLNFTINSTSLLVFISSKKIDEITNLEKFINEYFEFYGLWVYDEDIYFEIEYPEFKKGERFYDWLNEKIEYFLEEKDIGNCIKNIKKSILKGKDFFEDNDRKIMFGHLNCYENKVEIEILNKKTSQSERGLINADNAAVYLTNYSLFETKFPKFLKNKEVLGICGY